MIEKSVRSNKPTNILSPTPIDECISHLLMRHPKMFHFLTFRLLLTIFSSIAIFNPEMNKKPNLL